MSVYIYKKNQAIISKDIRRAVTLVIDKLNDTDNVIIKTLIRDEFKVEDSSNAISQAYISETDRKYIILCANKFNIYAQNAFLKILEDTPNNVFFIIIAQNKNVLLPTVRSRLMVSYLKAIKEKIDIDINLSNMSFEDIYIISKKVKYFNKIQSKLFLEEIFRKSVQEYNINFNEYELGIFQKSLELINLNANPLSIFNTILLIIRDKN